MSGDANQIHMNIPVVYRRNKNKIDEVWWNCMKANQPQIIVEKASKYATVKYDMYTCECDLNPESVNNIQKIFEKFATYNKDIIKGNPSFYYSRTSGMFENLDFSISLELAQEIANLIMNPKNHCHSTSEFNWGIKCPH